MKKMSNFSNNELIRDQLKKKVSFYSMNQYNFIGH
ncbi:hypothetical protein OAL24_00352 [Oenococcus sicerae]|nr:hypothetical protein OAL24_00352 [Oenococcus sicerae]